MTNPAKQPGWQRISWEQVLYAAILLLALALRLANLGDAPLSDREASLALQAVQVSSPVPASADFPLSEQPGYVLPTALLFSLFGSSSALARFWPALAGGLLVLVPLLWRTELWRPVTGRPVSGRTVSGRPVSGGAGQGSTVSGRSILELAALGQRAALLLSLGLAIDPALTALSRQAGGEMMAITAALFAVSLWRVRQPALAGVAGGLALLCGPALIAGVLAVGLTVAATRFFAGLAADPAQRERSAEEVIGTMVDDPAQRERSAEEVIGTMVDDLGQRERSAEEVIGTVIDDLAGRVPGGEGLVTLYVPLEEDAPGEEEAPATPQGDGKHPLRLALLSATLVILLVGTAFLRQPQGLSAWFAALPDYFAGWTGQGEVIAGRLLASLLFYTALPLLFGLLSLGRALIDSRRSAEIGALPLVTGLWLIFALLHALLYPGRGLVDLAWALIPLWVLAALELERLTVGNLRDPVALGQALLVVILMALFWYTLAALTRTVPGIETGNMRLVVMAGLLALVLLSTILVSFGWSWETGQRGLLTGLAAGLLIYQLAALFGASHQAAGRDVALWSASPAPQQADLLLDTVADLSTWQTGRPVEAGILSTVSSPALNWVLRDFPNARFADALPPSENSALVISPQQDTLPTLAAAYSGQDFAWRTWPAWNDSLPPDVGLWLTFREAPRQSEVIILWARTDIFPGGSPAAQNAAP